MSLQLRSIYIQFIILSIFFVGYSQVGVLLVKKKRNNYTLEYITFINIKYNIMSIRGI